MILMLSALHMAITKSPSFSEIHHKFILSGYPDATAGLQAEANGITSKSIRAISAFPFLMSLDALKISLFDGGGKSEQDILDEMVHILALIQGNKVVHEQINPWTKRHNLEPWNESQDMLNEWKSDTSEFDAD